VMKLTIRSGILKVSGNRLLTAPQYWRLEDYSNLTHAEMMDLQQDQTGTIVDSDSSITMSPKGISTIRVSGVASLSLPGPIAQARYHQQSCSLVLLTCNRFVVFRARKATS